MYLKTYSMEHMIMAELKPVTGLTLRPYQVIGRDWLENGERKMLTDWPGLGKTLQASEAAKQHKPVLISAPTYLTRQWYDFLRMQYPKDRVRLCTGADLHRFDRQARLLKRADWYIVNHAMFRSEDYKTPQGDIAQRPIFKLPDVKTVILDESHHFRNRTALQSIGAAKFCRDMDKRVYLLTASPVWKNADDIWNQLHILQPELFPSYNDFVDTFLIVDDSLYGPKILGVKRSVKKQLDQLLSIVKFGRTYKQVGRYLPDTIKSEIMVEFPKELMKKYREVLTGYILMLEDGDDGMVFSSYMEIMHTLRMITNWPGKQEALASRLEDTGKPALVFTWYKETAYQLGKLLGGPKKCVVITGDTAPNDRPKIAREAYQKGKHVVANLHAMSEGVNLQDMRHVIFYEGDWAPGKNFQALSRVVRDRNDGGKDKEPVLVDYILVPRTIDTAIHKVSQRREASIKELMQEILM